VTATIAVGADLSGVAITPNGNFAYVASVVSSTVFVIRTALNAVVDSIPGTSFAIGIAIVPSGASAYVTLIVDASVAVIDTATDTIAAVVPVGLFPVLPAVTPNGSFVYVTNSGDKSVSVIDTATNLVTAIIPVGNFPQGIAILIKPPTSKDQCKKGGWQNFAPMFKNQGDCVSYVNHL
jgi:YVTN family beta-propeller protein